MPDDPQAPLELTADILPAEPEVERVSLVPT